jgi:hypothetical protein
MKPVLLRALLLGAAVFLPAGAASAHKVSDSYLSLAVEGDKISGHWDIALRDLDYAIGLDDNEDGAITGDEVKKHESAIAAYALSRLKLAAGGGNCPITVSEHLIGNHTDGAYEVMRFSAQCPGTIQSLVVDYKLLFDIDPSHRGLLRLQHGAKIDTAVMNPEHSVQRFEIGESPAWSQFGQYLVEGVWHIWMGYDHILFLLSLLLPAVLTYRSGRWQPVAKFSDAFWDVLKIVTAFTVAHSITLTLATLQVIALPSRLVESAIAFSVVLAALNNVFPLFQGRRWVVAGGFGLIHGFGFASVLTDLGLPQGALALALVGFNTGVEVGQLSIVSVFLPLAYFMRKSALYRKVIFIGGSALIVLIASVWFVERAFLVEIFGMQIFGR